jgi:hypothetical protein
MVDFLSILIFLISLYLNIFSSKYCFLLSIKNYLRFISLIGIIFLIIHFIFNYEEIYLFYKYCFYLELINIEFFFGENDILFENTLKLINRYFYFILLLTTLYHLYYINVHLEISLNFFIIFILNLFYLTLFYLFIYLNLNIFVFYLLLKVILLNIS